MPGDITNTNVLMALNELIDAINQLAAKLVPEGPGPDGSYDPPLDGTILGGLTGAAGGGAAGVGGAGGLSNQPFPDGYLATKCLTAKRAVGYIVSIPEWIEQGLRDGLVIVGISLAAVFLAPHLGVLAAYFTIAHLELFIAAFEGLLTVVGGTQLFAMESYNAKLSFLTETIACKIYSAATAGEAVADIHAFVDTRYDMNEWERKMTKALFNSTIIGAVWTNPQRFNPTPPVEFPYPGWGISPIPEYDRWPNYDCSDCPDPNDPWACDDTVTTVPFQQVDISTSPTWTLLGAQPIGTQFTLTSQKYGFSNKCTLWKAELQPSCLKLISCTTVNLTLSLSNADHPTWGPWEEVPIATLFAGATCNLLELSAPDTEDEFEAVFLAY